MKGLLGRIYEPETVPMLSDEYREKSAYSVSVTVLEQQKKGFFAVDGLENLQARIYPYAYGQTMKPFDETRTITDRIKLYGYYPRIHSGYFVRVLQQCGEVVMYDVHDVEHDGDPLRSTLIVKRRMVDKK